MEFYTDTPCFIYIESGVETLNHDDINCHRHNGTIRLNAGASIALPQGATLLSDFVNETPYLSAYLVFFDDDIVTDYLSKEKKPLFIRRSVRSIAGRGRIAILPRSLRQFAITSTIPPI